MAVVATLLVAIGTGFGSEGGTLGRVVGTRLEAALDGTPRRWRWSREVRGGGGDVAVRISRDELRMSPAIDELAVASRAAAWSGERAGVRGELRARGCLLCVSGEWSRELRPGGEVGSEGARGGLAAGVEASGRLAFASAEADGRLERDVGSVGSAFAQGRVRGTIGAEADATARVHVDGSSIDAEVDAGAMVGAVARAEARVGVDLLGVAIRQSARAEGWAGAGIRGTAGVRRSPGVTSWRFGWGGALGLGAATEWSGTVDASAVPAGHRRLAGAALTAALRTAFGLSVMPTIPPMPKEQR